MAEFADRVRIKTTAETESLGLAGREGIACGWTTPSVLPVSVIGTTIEDSAVNVYFDELGTGYWFSEELIEELGNGAGTAVGFPGLPDEWIRHADGTWHRRSRPA